MDPRRRHADWATRAARAVAAACLLVAVGCGDVLGLHDLEQDTDARARADAPVEELASPASGDAAVSSTAAGDDAAATAPAALEGTDVTPLGDAAPLAAEAAPATEPTVDTAPPPTVDAAPGVDAGCDGCGPPACSVAHSNGEGQTFVDCAPRGTHDATEALSACEAFAGRAADCTTQTCSQGTMGTSGGGNGKGNAKDDEAVCSTGGASCVCWVYAGTDVGLVSTATVDKCEPCAKGMTPWN